MCQPNNIGGSFYWQVLFNLVLNEGWHQGELEEAICTCFCVGLQWSRTQSKAHKEAWQGPLITCLYDTVNWLICSLSFSPQNVLSGMRKHGVIVICRWIYGCCYLYVYEAIKFDISLGTRDGLVAYVLTITEGTKIIVFNFPSNRVTCSLVCNLSEGNKRMNLSLILKLLLLSHIRHYPTRESKTERNVEK